MFSTRIPPFAEAPGAGVFLPKTWADQELQSHT